MFIALVYLLIHKNKWRSAALNAFIDFYKEVIH